MIFRFRINSQELKKIKCSLLQDKVSAMLRAHRQGNSLMIFDRESARWLLDNVKLIEQDRGALGRIFLQSTQTGDIFRRAEIYVDVTLPGTEMDLVESGGIINLPIDHPDFDELLRRPILLVDDIANDLEIFSFVLKNMPSDYGGLPVAYEGAHGGGSRIFETAAIKVSERRIVVALVDSDRRAPMEESKEAEIAKRMENLKWPLAFFRILPGAELENLIGLEAIGKIAHIAQPITMAALLKIRSAEMRAGATVADRYEWHFDLKEGVSEHRLQRLSNPQTQSWVEQKLALGGYKRPGCHLPGFGTKLVQEVLASNSALAELRSTVRSSEWQSLFGLFFSKISWILAATVRQTT